MGILYTSGLFTVKGAKEGVIGNIFTRFMGVGDLRNEPRCWEWECHIVELNVLDINFIIFHNSSHSKLRGGVRRFDKW